MPRVTTSRVAKVAVAIVILVLVLHYTINQENPDETFPQARNEDNLKHDKVIKPRQVKPVNTKKRKEHGMKIKQRSESIVKAIKGPPKDEDIGEEEEKAWRAKMNHRNTERKTFLKKVCEESYSKSFKTWHQVAADPSRLRPLIANDDHHFIYSIVYKVGSTNWERVIVQDLGGFKNVPNQKLYSHSALKWMPKYTSSEAQQRLESYTKFIFVRDPLSRILSGFKDKFVDHHNAVFSKMARFIITNYRIDGDAKSSANITFTEFIRYLVAKEGHRSNVHWKPIHKQNFPCEIEYDIIGKLEDAHEDIPYVLKRVGIYNLTDYGKAPPVKSSNDMIVKYYSELPKDLLHKLYQIYEPDFKLFGYEMPESFTAD